MDLENSDKKKGSYKNKQFFNRSITHADIDNANLF